jgi:hypothetical protein
METEDTADPNKAQILSDLQGWQQEWLRRLNLAATTAKDLAAILEAELVSARCGGTTMAVNGMRKADKARDVMEAIAHVESLWEGYYLCRWPGMPD